MSACTSTFKVAKGLRLHCAQHLGTSRNWKHSARYLGIRWYWTTAEAELQPEDPYEDDDPFEVDR